MVGFGGDPVGDLWCAVSLKTRNSVLQQAVRPGDALMLAQVLKPGLDQECLDETAFLRGILEHAPAIGTVTAAFTCQTVKLASVLFRSPLRIGSVSFACQCSSGLPFLLSPFLEAISLCSQSGASA